MGHFDISIGLTLALTDKPQSGQIGRDRVSFFIADRSQVAPIVYTYAIGQVKDMTPAGALAMVRETFARSLEAAGHTTVVRARSRATLSEGFEAAATRVLGRFWPGFVAVHMTWGAINELTTLLGYARLSAGLLNTPEEVDVALAAVRAM